MVLRPIPFAALAIATAVQLLQAGFNAETGSFIFQRYTPKQYGASPQNWATAQDRLGKMYFANEDGVLEFDGLSWRMIPVKHGNLTRSVAVDASGKVFVGGNGDFGMLQPDSGGVLQFVSLLDRVPAKDREFSHVWRILPTPAGVYFSAYNRLFRLNPDGTIRVWRPQSNFGRAFAAAGGVYIKTRELGLLRVEGDNLVPLPGGSIFTKLSITSGTNVPGQIGAGLIGTARMLYRLSPSGAEPFPTRADDWFAANVVNAVLVLPGGEIAVGSQKGGLAFISPAGDLDRVITKAEGLPDDTVDSIFPDDQGGVWITGNNGLARFNPGFSSFGANAGVEGDVTCMIRQEGVLYTGTTVGMFALTSTAGAAPRFERVQGITGTVSALLTRDHTLLAAAGGDGVYQISGKSARRILATDQAVYDLTSSLSDPAVVYAAARAHVFELRESGSAWATVASFDAPAEEFRSVLEDNDGKVWTATASSSIWRLDFRQDPVRSEKFAAAQGVPTGLVNVNRLNGRVTFATSKGLKSFASSVGRFGPDLSLGAEYANGSRDVINVFQSTQGDVWVTGKNYHDLLRGSSKGFEPHLAPLHAAGIQGISWMSLDPDGTAWATGADYVLHRFESALAGNPDRSFRVLTRRIQPDGAKEALYSGAGAFNFVQLPWSANALRFEFASPFYEDPAAVEYQTLLEGNDRDWSQWTREPSQKYTNLSARDYRFHIRARSPHGAVNEESAIAFAVLPPWYRTWWAWLMWLACAGVGVWGLVKWRTRQLVADKHRLETIVEERTVEIRDQERRTHSLLLNILPEKVADELKTTGAVKPMAFDDVTVCFTDFAGFTLSSEKMQPARLVDALNEYFTRFDEIMARYGLEKLKTIGDSYMFASGLPAARSSHAVDAVLAAMEMVDVVKELAEKTDGTGWNIRVGLHSGPVIAGVVGIRKFAFDIWGDTVNFASRMESSGVPGKVNMSERTCALTRGLVDCESRGLVKIKEGRYLPMFLAVGPVDDFATRYESEFGRSAPEFRFRDPTAPAAATLIGSEG